MMRSIYLLLIINMVKSQAGSLNITSLRVPSTANHEAPLDCRYVIKDLQLYDVKWYKDGLQFFRCLPNGEVNEYPVEGVKIYYTKYVQIGSCPLTLTALSSKSSGEYKCEVSTEGPSFNVATSSARLRVVPYVKKNDIQGINRQHSTDHPKHQELNTTWHAYSSKGFLQTSTKHIPLYYVLFIIVIYPNAIL